MKVPLLMICEFSFFFAGLSMAQAQQSIGTVGVQDATVAGALEVSNGRAILVGNTTVTARDRVAEIALNRGGSVKVCATSGLHLTAGKSVDAAGGSVPLMLALDRGAIEVQMAATTRDVVMTPDLRFTMRGDGPLDLELRVTRNGDTCVENRGTQAPVLNVADQFGEAAYELRAGQHVLFEHGSLKEVVDHESSSCGCPPEATMSVADALLHPGSGNSTAADVATAAKPAAEEHPFPAAVSAGLAPPSAVPQAAAGAAHTQVSAALSSNEGADSLAVPKPTEKAPTSAPAPAVVAAPAAVAAPSPVAPPPALPEQKRDLVHVVGRFFKRMFGGG
jgi:hypothetical protein